MVVRALRVAALLLVLVAAKVGWHGSASDENGLYTGQSNLHRAAQLVMLAAVLLVVAAVIRYRRLRAR